MENYTVTGLTGIDTLVWIRGVVLVCYVGYGEVTGNLIREPGQRLPCVFLPAISQIFFDYAP